MNVLRAVALAFRIVCQEMQVSFYAVPTFRAWLAASQSGCLTLADALIVHDDIECVGKKIEATCYVNVDKGRLAARALAQYVVVCISASELPGATVRTTSVTAAWRLDEFMAGRVRAFLESISHDKICPQFHVVENGIGGTFSKSLPSSSVASSVSSELDLTTLARSLLSEEDFDEAKGNPALLLGYSTKPMYFEKFDYGHIAVGISCFSTPGRDPNIRKMRTIISIREMNCLQRIDIDLGWSHAYVSPAVIALRSGAFPSFCSVVHAHRMALHRIADPACISVRHAFTHAATFLMGSAFLPRALQLCLQSTGGFQRALLQKLFNRQKGFHATAFGNVARHVACKIASHQARVVLSSHNEEADREWVVFIATTMLWKYLKTHL